MTEFVDKTTSSNQNNFEAIIDSSNDEDIEEDYSESYSSTSGSWVIDDTANDTGCAEFKLSSDELPTFSIQSVSPSGRSLSPITYAAEPISLFNLSISPISSMNDLTQLNEMDDDLFGVSSLEGTANGKRKDSDIDDDDERVSLDEITAQIKSPPASQLHCSGKRLNLETIFEGVFLETPPKKRKFDSWRMRIKEITAERLHMYVQEQQLTPKTDQDATASNLCNIFDTKIDLS